MKEVVHLSIVLASIVLLLIAAKSFSICTAQCKQKREKGRKERKGAETHIRQCLS